MELLRTRLCAWEPIGIDALALAPATSSTPASEPRLAIGRANGALELWDTTTWHMHSTSLGCDKRGFRGIVWFAAGADADGDEDVQGVRLFTAGLHGEITEWDLTTLSVKTSLASGGGAIWSFCEVNQRVLAACEDGSVRVFSMGAGDVELFHTKRIVVGQNRLLSMAPFGKGMFFVGGSDGMITKWSLNTSTCEARMQVEKAGKDQETLVWALACLGEHGLASGDSLGVVTIWDPVMCVVLQRFVQHQADVLTLTASPDGNILVSAGIDASISTFCRQTSGEQQWFFRNSDAGHTHDVRALALDVTDNGRKQIVSGGVSGELLVHSLKLVASAKRGKALRCSGFSPCFQKASLAEDSRLVICQRNTQLELHYLGQPKESAESVPGGVAAWAGAAEVWPSRLPQAQWLVRSALTRGADGHHLACTAITSDGSNFAASDASGTRLFHLNVSELEVLREREFPDSLLGVSSRSLLFCGESLLVMAAWDSHKLHVVNVQKLKVTACFSEHSAPVMLLASAGEWLASADNSGSVHLYNLDSLRHQVRVPAGSSQEFPTALSFVRSGKCLIVALSTHKVLIYDVETRALATSVPSLINVPVEVVPLQDRICNITPLPSLPDKLILSGHNFVVALDLQQLALAEKEKSARGALVPLTETPSKKKKGAKRKATDDQKHISDPTDISPCTWRTYSKMGLQHIFGLWALHDGRWGKPVLEDHFLQPGSSTKSEKDGSDSEKRKRMDIKAMLLTLEVAPETIEKSLPPAFEKKKYLPTQ